MMLQLTDETQMSKTHLTHLAAVAIWLNGGLPAAYAAGPPSANEMLPGCKAFLSATEGRTNNAANRDPALALFIGRCMGTIEAITSSAYSLGICLPIGPASPEGPTIGQITRVVVNFIEAHPAKMHEGFVPLAVQALWGAWRCKPGENPLGQRP
jgi:hypothetical protein